MNTNDTSGPIPSAWHARPDRAVDFTIMYVVHDAFRRDLRRLTAAVEAGRIADPAVRSGWATFKNQLHVHHTAEDTSLWPPLRQKVTRPEDMAVLDAMETEHGRIDPLLAQVAVWRRGYARTPRWNTAATPTRTLTRAGKPAA